MAKKIMKLRDWRIFIIWVSLGILFYGLLFNFAVMDFRAGLNVNRGKFVTPVQKLEEMSPDFVNFYNILKTIENEDEASAADRINSYFYQSNDTYLKSYLEEFQRYINTKKAKLKRPVYFFNEMKSLSQYLQSKYRQKKNDSENYAQVIPFYILKKYDSASKNTLNLCEIYLRENINDSHLTKNAAIVICLKIRRMYEADGLIKSTENLKKIQGNIDIYRQLYPGELKDNPKFMDEINWLDSFYSFITDRINNPVMGIFSRWSYNKNIKGLGE